MFEVQATKLTILLYEYFKYNIHLSILVKLVTNITIEKMQFKIQMVAKTVFERDFFHLGICVD